MKKLFPLLFSLIFLITCQTLPIKTKPEARFKGVDIKAISLQDVTLRFDLEIYNPYPVKLKLKEVDLVLFVEGKRLMRTKTARGLKVKARGSQVSSFDLVLKYKNISRIIRNYANKDYLNLGIHATIAIPLPKLPQVPPEAKFSYKLQSRIPALKPEISIARFRVKMPTQKDITKIINRERKKLNAGKVYGMFSDILKGRKPEKIIDPASIDLPLKVTFDIVMKNKTRAALKFKKLQYSFLVNNSKLVDGETSSIKNTGNTSILSIANSFSTKAMSSSILKAFRGKRGSFHLKGEALLKLPDSVKKTPLKLKFDETGAFRLQ